MLKVGITGGIGSGKTFVCKIFSSLGIPVFDADREARELVNTDEKVKAKIKKEFGDNLYNASGKLDRKKMAAKVFNNKTALEKLNAIIHPTVISNAEAWMKKQDTPYSLREAAILFESGASKGLDKIITVTAPEEIRIKRVMERDNKTREDVLAIIQNQTSDKEKIKLSDFAIINDEKEIVVAAGVKYS